MKTRHGDERVKDGKKEKEEKHSQKGTGIRPQQASGSAPSVENTVFDYAHQVVFDLRVGHLSEAINPSLSVRGQFLDLHSGLRKLGERFRNSVLMTSRSIQSWLQFA
ncbi:hypothetical protein E2C01_056767 [Portunus trituberculatus]|uniref:Uncharacterized protein n=1 Tax=Portunus trituberculatus TaxID=210409 RepID=A0A5B7H0H5_PORTR|nr:hypothetical protein [Portunus trituberculatus]